jgi:DNA-directed RNA polymerase beta' subunit
MPKVGKQKFPYTKFGKKMAAAERRKAKKKIVKKRKIKEVMAPPVEVVEEATSTEKAELLTLYDKLKELGIHSIGDLENKIARL